MDFTTIAVNALFYAVIFGFCLSGLARPKTRKCKFCKSVIDTKATTCPNCRRSQPLAVGAYGPGVIKYSLIIFVILFVLLTIHSLSH